MPHEDDEGSLWADQLNNGSTAFPVFVYETNGENTGYCTNDTPIEYAPTGTLGTDDQPPFNRAGDLPGAPTGFAGEGPPPEYYGAQGDNPPVFPHDPALSPATGWGPLLTAGRYTGTAASGSSFTEGFDGPCRAGRLASMTMMFSQENAALARLSPLASRSSFPSVTPGQAPSGQVCFTERLGESYQAEAGTYATPGSDGTWSSAAVPAGTVSGKDPCAYYWLTPTGDILAFDLGDQSLGYRSACPSDEGGRLTTGGVWPDETIGFDSAGTYPEGARPGDGSGCPGDLPDGREAYTASPSDAVWMIRQVLRSGLLPAGLPLAAVNGSAFLDGFNPAVPTVSPGPVGPASVGPGPVGPGPSAGPPAPPGLIPPPPSASTTASIDVDSNQGATACYWLTGGGSSCASQPPPDACERYLHPNHLSVGLALRWNRPVTSVTQFSALCAGDPAAAATFGTRNPADGAAFWTAIFNNDGTGTGAEGVYRAYAWDTGLTAFDPYGNVPSTCPDSGVPESQGQWQFACQEAVSELPGVGPETPPGDGVRGMRNAYAGTTGEGFTYPL